MSVFSSKFDLVTEESFAAPGAVAVMLDVGRSGTAYDTNGTPVPGSLKAGSIVKMDVDSGKAVVAQTADLLTAAPVLPLVVIDGTDTFSGAFTSKVTCLAGGFQMKTDQFVVADTAGGELAYKPGNPVSFGKDSASAGKICGWKAGRQILGFVGKDGLSVDGKLHVVVVSKA